MDNRKQPFILELVLKLVSIFYSSILKDELGPEARAFFINLFYVAIGTFISSGLTFAFTIIGGRILGPIEFGKFSLIQSAAFILYIPMLAGFGTALVKLTSETNDFGRQREIISTAYVLTILTLTGSLIVFFSFQSWLGSILSLSHELVIVTIFISAAYAIYTLAISTQRGLRTMKDYAIWQPIYAFIVIISFGLIIIIKNYTFQAMALPLLLSYGITGFAIIILLIKRHYIRLQYNRATAAQLNKYALFGLIVLTSSSIYVNIGKIFVGHYMSFSDVGVYSAYYGTSMNLGSIIFLTFNTVFFPTISAYQDKNPILTKLDKILPYLIAVGTLGIFAFEFIIIRLYGSHYPRDYMLMLSFAITTVLSIWYSIYAWVFNAEGLKGARFGSVSIIIVAILVVILSYVFIPHLGLEGAVGAAAIAFAGGVLYLRLARKTVFPDPLQP